MYSMFAFVIYFVLRACFKSTSYSYGSQCLLDHRVWSFAHTFFFFLFTCDCFFAVYSRYHEYAFVFLFLVCVHLCVFRTTKTYGIYTMVVFLVVVRHVSVIVYMRARGNVSIHVAFVDGICSTVYCCMTFHYFVSW